MGARDAGDGVAEFLDHRLDVERDDRLVLDDQHVGRDLLGDFLAGSLDQRAGLRGRDVHDRRDFIDRKALDGAQQEGLARTRRQSFEVALG